MELSIPQLVDALKAELEKESPKMLDSSEFQYFCKELMDNYTALVPKVRLKNLSADAIGLAIGELGNTAIPSGYGRHLFDRFVEKLKTLHHHAVAS